MYPTRIGPSPTAMEDNYTGHQRGQSGNTRNDGTPNRFPRDPKSGYLVGDLSRLQTFKNIDIENIISSYTLLVVAMHFVAPRVLTLLFLFYSLAMPLPRTARICFA